jgi:hypothetical protein
MHARRYFFDARLSDPERAHEALARIRALYAIERDAKAEGLSGAALAAYRQEQAGPILVAFADWLADQYGRVLPKSPIGEAIGYAPTSVPPWACTSATGGWRSTMARPSRPSARWLSGARTGCTWAATADCNRRPCC